ncbi:MAG: NAD+ synthase [Thaumarchaeota archaeon]|nr:NAD+ synthase [Nitrososphaerota archaeon]
MALVNQVLDEIKNQDYKKIIQSIESFLKNKISENNANGVVFGLSGGIDSVVVAYLCSNVFKKNTLALIMPDSKISPKTETQDALKIVGNLGLDYKLLDINPIHASFSKYLEPNETALGNLRARIRASILYYYANAKNHLVVGTSDKSEYLIGYFTKFGDGSSDLMPIASLYKTQVRELAKTLGVSDSIISKKSSPHLWKEHTAEEEIGFSYEMIDSVLCCIVDKKLALDNTAKKTGIDKTTVEKIYQLYKKSQHKRITPDKLE